MERMCKEEVVSNLKYYPGKTGRNEENYKILSEKYRLADH
jgi:hypothetical protein